MDRMRRLRRTENIRKMVRESHVRIDELIYPLFIIEGEDICRPVESMPGIFQYSVDRLDEELERIDKAGISSVLLFGIPACKDETGTGAYDENGVVQQAIRHIRAKYPDMVIIADVCLCEYTSHGHCGILSGGEVDNDLTLPLLAKIAVS